MSGKRYIYIYNEKSLYCKEDSESAKEDYTIGNKVQRNVGQLHWSTHFETDGTNVNRKLTAKS